jgi:hypothetical protein
MQNGDNSENPSGTLSNRGLAFVYGLEVAPREKRSRPNGSPYGYWPDSAFALLMHSLAKDLNDHLYT